MGFEGIYSMSNQGLRTHAWQKFMAFWCIKAIKVNTYHKRNQTLLEIREANREGIIHAYTTTQRVSNMLMH